MTTEDVLVQRIKEYREKQTDRKQITQTTVVFYASRVRILYEMFGGDLPLVAYLSQYPRVMADIGVKYPKLKTQRPTVYAVITALEAFDGEKTVVEQYRQRFKELAEEVNKEAVEVKRPNEAENWITRADIFKKMGQLEYIAQGQTGAQWFDTYQQYMVLSLYTLIPPVRNNYVDVLVYETRAVDMDKEHNYIFMEERQLVLNNYKTRGTYGVIEIELPVELIRIVEEWMRVRVSVYSELSDRRELLFNTRKIVPMGKSNLIMYLHKIFGKNISMSMLRKIYLSEKYSSSVSGQEMRRDAAVMGHSIHTQQTIYRKTD